MTSAFRALNREPVFNQRRQFGAQIDQLARGLHAHTPSYRQRHLLFGDIGATALKREFQGFTAWRKDNGSAFENAARHVLGPRAGSYRPTCQQESDEMSSGERHSNPAPRANGAMSRHLASPDPETATVPTASGDLAADVYRTRQGRRRGVIVFVHGFCGGREENGLFGSLARYANEAGYDAVSYDWRGIGGSAGEFPDTTLEDHVADFQSVVGWTKQRVARPSERVFAVGFSLGAALVGLGLQREVPLDSIAYLSPAVRPKFSMWPRYDTAPIQAALRMQGVVEKPGSRVLLGRPILESLRDTDLGPGAFDTKVPLLVCHGTADVRIDCGFTQELVVERGEDRDFGYLQFADASHSFRPEEHAWRLLAAALTSWFGGARSRQLSGDDASDSEEARELSLA